MNVSLTKELETLVEKKVKSGLYHTASEVVRDALRLLEERDRLYKHRLLELRKEIKKGLESGPATAFDVEDLKARVQKNAGARKRQKAG
jgi:antitoxin ParD1/3/4